MNDLQNAFVNFPVADGNLERIIGTTFVKLAVCRKRNRKKEQNICVLDMLLEPLVGAETLSGRIPLDQAERFHFPEMDKSDMHLPSAVHF